MNYTNQFQSETEDKLANYTIPIKTPENGKNDVEIFQSPLNSGDDNTSVQNLNNESGNTNYNARFFPNPTQIMFLPPPPPPSDNNNMTAKRKYLGIDDPALPEELLNLMKPLHCQLCDVKLNSTSSSHMHYQSKNHDKKINVWLQDWSKKTGEPLPKRKKILKPETPVGPNAFHCEVCDLALTSVQHAEQHYSGKRHRAVMYGQAQPSGSGYYNQQGKWVRTQSNVKTDSTGRFGIGESFQALTTSTAEQKPITKPLPTIIDPARFCSVCNIQMARETQMKAHLEGSKHAKKLRAMNAPPYTSSNDTLLKSVNESIQQSNQIQQTATTNNSTSSIQTTTTITSTNPSQKQDISIYRTPSGSFYCQACDITLAQETLFNQHLNSKKHIKKNNKNFST